METTFLFITFYYSSSRELLPFETRKMVCYSDEDFVALKSLCRKHCRQILRNGSVCKPSDVVYRLTPVSERQYDESTYSLL
jgi:hypothetical protein